MSKSPEGNRLRIRRCPFLIVGWLVALVRAWRQRQDHPGAPLASRSHWDQHRDQHRGNAF